MEVRQTRHQEIKLVKYDTPYANIRYTGRSSSFLALDSQPLWQILREYKVCATGITVSTYANKGEFNAVWDDRANYFSAAIGDDDCPLEGTMAVTGTFSFSPSGLQNGGLHSFVTLNDSLWLPIPATPLANRNGISIQNESGIDIKYRYIDTDPVWQGTRIGGNGGERFLDIKDTIILYGRAAPGGSPVIIVEEIS